MQVLTDAGNVKGCIQVTSNSVQVAFCINKQLYDLVESSIASLVQRVVFIDHVYIRLGSILQYLHISS